MFGRNKLEFYVALHPRENKPVSIDEIRLLVEQHPRIVKVRDHGLLPLHSALYSSGGTSIAVIQFLIDQYPESVQMKTKYGDLPLFIAVGNPFTSLEVFQLLVEKYPRAVLAKNTFGLSLLKIALHDYGFSPPPLSRSVAFSDVIQLLAETHCEIVQNEIDREGQLSFREAINLNLSNLSIDAIREISRCLPSVVHKKDKSGWLPLHLALREHSPLNYIRFLVQLYPQSLRERTNQEGYLPLHCAVEAENPSIDVVQFLVQEFPESLNLPFRGGVREKDKNGQLPLHVAVNSDSPSIEVIRLLIDLYPKGVEEKDKGGQLPIHVALNIPTTSTELIRLLVEQYPRGVIEKDYNGWIPISKAVVNAAVDRNDAHNEVIRYVTEKYAEVVQEECKEEGQMPIHRVIDFSNTSIDAIRSVFDKFPGGVHEKDELGRLPLHRVLKSGQLVFQLDGRLTMFDLDGRYTFNLDSIRCLLQLYPKRLHERTNEGYLPLHCAVNADFPSLDIVRFLVEEFPKSVNERTTSTTTKTDHDDELLALQLAAAAKPSCFLKSDSLDVIYYLIRQSPSGLWSLAATTGVAKHSQSSQKEAVAATTATVLPRQPLRKIIHQGKQCFSSMTGRGDVRLLYKKSQSRWVGVSLKAHPSVNRKR